MPLAALNLQSPAAAVLMLLVYDLILILSRPHRIKQPLLQVQRPALLQYHLAKQRAQQQG
jgi:hypothetical protein